MEGSRVKIVGVSDLHGTLPIIPPCDLLLIGGDICPVRDHSISRQADWLDTVFRFWLENAPARKVVGVAGNHDLIFEQAPEDVPRNLQWTYLQDSGVDWEGLHIWGSPWQPWFFDWAFNLYEPELMTKWYLIPQDTDILVLHGPPRGYGDGVPEGDGVRRTGSPSLLKRIEEIAPRVAIFGHIHEGRGQWQLGRTVMANVTILDERYNQVYPPWEYELELQAGSVSAGPV
jgi:Icc-related predicted phosphoesterase